MTCPTCDDWCTLCSRSTCHCGEHEDVCPSCLLIVAPEQESHHGEICARVTAQRNHVITIPRRDS